MSGSVTFRSVSPAKSDGAVEVDGKGTGTAQFYTVSFCSNWVPHTLLSARLSSCILFHMRDDAYIRKSS